MEFIKRQEMIAFLEKAVEYYHTSAPALSDWLDDLYMRLSDSCNVDLREILFIEKLKEDGTWMHPNYASNQQYHLLNRLGVSTTGHVGF